MTDFCYWEVYKDLDFYIMLAISCISLLILIYTIKQSIKIIKVRHKLDKRVLLIYGFCVMWALCYLIKTVFGVLQYALVLRNNYSTKSMLMASQLFCVLDTLPTFFLQGLLILIPYFWLKNITTFLQSIKRDIQIDKLFIKFFSIYDYLRVFIYFGLMGIQLALDQTTQQVEYFCDTIVLVVIVQAFLNLILLAYGVWKLMANFTALNLNDQKDMKKFRNQYFTMIGCTLVRFIIDFYFILFQKLSRDDDQNCFQYRFSDYVFTTVYVIIGSSLMHFVPIITILTIYKINYRALKQQKLLQD